MAYQLLWHFVKLQHITRVKGISLWEQMLNIYKKYGFYKEGQVSIVLKGADGAMEIKNMMDRMRKNPPSKLGNYTVLEVRDYKEHTILRNDGTKRYNRSSFFKCSIL